MARLAPALAGLLLAAAPATADVTPREVWEDWLASAQEDDAEVTTEAVEETEDGLVIRGLSMIAASEEGERYALEVDRIALVQNPDGTVGVTPSPEYPIILTNTEEDGTLRETRLLVQHPDLEMTVADDGGVRSHTFSAPEISVTIVESLSGGEPLDVSGGIVLTGAEGRYDIGEAEEGESALTAARVSVDFDGTDPEGGGTFDLDLAMEDVESENMLQIVSSDTAAIARELSEGESRQGSFSAGSTTFRLESQDAGRDVTLSASTGGGETTVTVLPEGLTYASETGQARLAVSGSELPLPEVAIDIDSATLGFSAPLLAGEEPQPFAFSVSMLDVSLDEGIWNMVDPAGILSRDPGAIVADISGDMLVEEDLEATGMADASGGGVQTLSIDALRVALADAEVMAAGVLDFVEAAEGETRPVGEIDVVLNGVPELIERLVQAGILPQEQAMGTQMMIGMFARPGATAGELVSNVRFTEDGRVFVNEQQVQ